jgi:hypothetical protein
MFDLRGGIKTVFYPFSFCLDLGGGDRDVVRLDHRFPEYTECPASSRPCTSYTRLWACGAGQRSGPGRPSDKPRRSAGVSFAEHKFHQSAGGPYARHVMAR